MPICKCNPKEHFKHFLYMKWERCPLEDDRHTSFMVFLCQNCNGVDFLPTENMKLALKKGTEKTKKILKAIIDEYPEMKQFEIWMEGYAATGERGTATFLGSHEGETFQQACEKAIDSRDMDKKHYNPEKNTFWACRLFNNEKDARKSFG